MISLDSNLSRRAAEKSKLESWKFIQIKIVDAH